jgi:hypothetical protein
MNKFICAYAFCGLLTFGWVAADPCPLTNGWDFDWTSNQYVSVKCGQRDAAVMLALLNSAVWPLYVTYKIFERVRK